MAGRVWDDANLNGLYEDEEAGVPSALVELIRTADATRGNSDDRLLATTVTDTDGNYAFPETVAGQYYVRFLAQPVGGIGYRFTERDAGDDDEIDSDADQLSGASAVFDVLDDEQMVVDAGLVAEPTSIGFALRIGNEGTQQGTAVAVDNQGSVYLAGRNDLVSMDLDPGPGTSLVQSQGGTDAFLAKYDSSGQLLWGRVFGSSSADVIASTTVDAQGNVLVAGFTFGIIQLNTQAGPATIGTRLSKTGFVVKLNSSGAIQWAYSAGPNTEMYDVVADSLGNVFVTGLVSRASLASDAVVKGLSSSGVEQWTARATGSGAVAAQSLAVSENSVYVTGRFTEAADFDPSTSTVNLNSRGGSDAFLWRLSKSSGSFEAISQIGGSLSDVATGIDIASDGSVSIVGQFAGTVQFGDGSAIDDISANKLSVFAARFTASGEPLWARSPTNGGGGTSGLPQIVVDARGSSWITGAFTSTIDLDTQLLTANGGSDIFLWGIDRNGAGIAAHQVGGAGFDKGSGIAILRDCSRVLLTGHFENSVDFDPGAGLLALTSLPQPVPGVVNNPSQDAFLWNFSTVDGSITVADDEYETEEDTELEILVEDLLSNDTDVDSEALTLSIVGQPLHGTLEDQGDGVFLYTPDENYSGSDRFTYELSDGDGVSNLATVLLTVTPVNDEPLAEDDAGQVGEQGLLSVAAPGVLANDQDVDQGDTLSVVAVNGEEADVDQLITLPSGAILRVSADGSYEYDPNGQFEYLGAGQTEVDAFTYTIADSEGVTSEATVEITITGVNALPVAENDEYETEEDTELEILVEDLLSNDTDVDSEALTLTIVGQPLHGTLEDQGDGVFLYTPDENYSGSDRFTYELSDGDGVSNLATVLLTVTPVNDEPLAEDDAGQVGEQGLLSVAAPGVLANDQDVDQGDTLSVVAVNGEEADVDQLITLPSGAILRVSADGSYEYDPNGQFEYLGAGQTEVDAFTYTIADSEGVTSEATVEITITGVNALPVAENDEYETEEDTELEILVEDLLSNDSDVDSEALTLSIVGQPLHGTLEDQGDGVFLYTPDENYSGSDRFTYELSDGDGVSNLATVLLTVTPVNDEPLAEDDAGQVGEQGLLTVAAPGVLANDQDVDQGDTLTVVAVNGEEADVDQLITLPSGAILRVSADGSYQYDPNGQFEYLGAGQTEVDAFTYTIADSEGVTSEATVEITITGVNALPVAENDEYETEEDTELEILVEDLLSNDTDVDSEALTLTIVGQPLHGTLEDQGDGVFLYTPDENYSGSDRFTYELSDGDGVSNLATVFLTVTPVNDEPLAEDDAGQVGEQGLLSVAAPGVLANDQDVDQGDTLTVVAVNGEEADVDQLITLPSGAILRVAADGSYQYDPNGQFEYLGAGQTEVDAFTYTIADSEGVTSEATVEITITGVNALPVAENDEYETEEDTELEILVEDLLSNDTDVDSEALTLTIVGQPLHGTLEDQGDGVFLYTPDENYSGSDRFTYELSDGDGVSNLATVFLTVTPVNDEPVVAVDLEFEIDEGSEFVASGSFSDFDIDDSWTVIVDYGDGSDPEELDFDTDHTFELNHVYENNGEFVVTVEVIDGENSSAIGEIAVFVLNVDPQDLILDGPESGLIDEPLFFAGVFFDPGVADAFEVLVDWGDGSTETLEVTGSDGTWEFTAEHAYASDGNYNVTFEVSDGDGGVAIESVLVAIDEDDTPKPPGATLEDGILEISGSPADDAVTMLYSQGKIFVNGRYAGVNISQTFFVEDIELIVVKTYEGDDSLTISSFISLPVFVDVGAGSDQVTAGGGAAIIIGGEGDDFINGSSKRDIIIGGTGSDQIWGHGGSDLLIAGETSFDARKSALLAIMQEWTSARSLSQRIANIRTGSGPILGSTEIFFEPDETVLQDGDVDVLFGGADSDWFLYEQGIDGPTDKSSSEPLN